MYCTTLKKKTKQNTKQTPIPSSVLGYVLYLQLFFSWENGLLDYTLLKKSIYKLQKQDFKCYYFLGESFIELKLKKTGKKTVQSEGYF